MSEQRGTITLADPVLGDIEKQALSAVIDSQWLTMGQQVLRFEQAFASMHKRKDAVAVNSCTAALHLALLALGVGNGDEVLLPSLTFVATANAVLYVGGTPIFVDIESMQQPHLSLEHAESLLTKRTKAVIVVHYGGYLVDMKVWRDFCDLHGLLLIEDAAHSPECAGNDNFADASCYSFFTNKNMTTAEGGMLMAIDDNVLKRVRSLRSHGMTTSTLDRDRGHAFSYDVTMLGYNYRMDELRAAMGCAQLQRLSQWNTHRRQLTCCYRDIFANIDVDIEVAFSDNVVTDAHLLSVILPVACDRKQIMAKLRAAGIQSSIHYPPLHLFSHYRHILGKLSLEKTEEYCSRELSLPLHPSLKKDDVCHVVSCLKDITS